MGRECCMGDGCRTCMTHAVRVTEEHLSLPSVQEHAFQGLGQAVRDAFLLPKLEEWLQLKPTTIVSIW